METMAKKQPRSRRSFTPEFKAEVVELVRSHQSSTNTRSTRLPAGRRHNQPVRRIGATPLGDSLHPSA